MKTNLRLTLALMAAAFFAFSTPGLRAEDLAVRSSLGLNGCFAHDIQYSPGGALLVATCEAPKSIFYSLDDGAQWTYAEGGAYQSGQAGEIAITQAGVFTTVNSQLLFAAYTEGASAPAAWQSLAGGQGQPGVSTLAAHGVWLLVGSGNSVQVLDTRTNTAAGAAQPLPDEPGWPRRLAVGPNYAYALAQDNNGRQRESLYRASFEPDSGALGAWQKISNAPGLPTAAQAYIWNYSVHPATGALYIASRDLSTSPWTNVAYVSTDNGASFAPLPGMPQDGQGQPGCPSFNDACYSASDPSLFMLGACVTKNGGASFGSDIAWQINSTEGGQEGACAIHPLHPDQAAFVRTGVGFARLAGLQSKSSYGLSDFTRTISGLDGVSIYHMAQPDALKKRVLFSSSSGVGFADDFGGDQPSWQFPLCPEGDCAIFRSPANVAFDPENPDVLYTGGFSVHRGVVTGEGAGAQISWSNFAQKPPAYAGAGTLGPIYTTAHLPGTVVAGFSVVGFETPHSTGGLYFYDAASGAVTKQAIDGKPVSAFIALSPSLLFVAIGGEEQNPIAEKRGIWKSTDGGDSWERVTSDVLPETMLVLAFAYDAARDILYAATNSQGGMDPGKFQSGSVFRLSGALAGETKWLAPDSLPEQGSFRALSVEETTGNIFAGLNNKVLLSIDFGKTWLVYFTGMNGEQMSVVKSDSQPAPAGFGLAKGLMHTLGSGRLTQGSNVGLNALTVAAGEMPACRMAVSAKCTRSVRKDAACTLTASSYDALSGAAYAGKKLQFQQSANNKRWKKASPKLSTTKTDGSAKLKVTVAASTYFRAVVNSPQCTTSAVRVTVKKK